MSSDRPARGSRAELVLGPARLLTVLGWICIVLGGLVAAVADPLDVPRGSWLAAYLVLVGGVTQCAMGRDRSTYPTSVPPSGGWTQLVAWNLGNAVVIIGTLTGLPPLVYVGSALLVGALAVAWVATRRGHGASASVGMTASPTSPASVPEPAPVVGTRLWQWCYPALLVVLAVSIPVGMVLSSVRNT